MKLFSLCCCRIVLCMIRRHHRRREKHSSTVNWSLYECGVGGMDGCIVAIIIERYTKVVLEGLVLIEVEGVSSNVLSF